jgi:carboxyl-terminal processing protease
MSTHTIAGRFRAALPLLTLALLGAAPAAATGALPAQVAGDVHESYRVLTTTYYERVDPQALLAAASDALADLAKKHGVTVAPPQLRVEADPSATMAGLDAAIADVADQAHGSPSDYAYAAIAAMAHAVGDKYTQFFTPDEFRQFNDMLDPERISGIGVMIEAGDDANVRISYVVPTTPADRVGLRSGDVIVAIDNVLAKGLTVEDASKLLRGKPGSTVTLSIARDLAAPQDVAIKREELQPPTVWSKMLPGNVGYIYVMAFGKATTSEFDAALARLKTQGARAVAIDLRNDGGGYVDTALNISSRFIANKPLVTVEERGNHDTTITAEDETSFNFPVTVLVNAYTASASEITAGALQDDGIAMLVGAKTFGKGVMQTLTPLPDGAAIKVTTAHYLTPNKHDINLRGIEPDLRVDEPKNSRFGDVDRDPQLRAALLLLQKKIAEAKPPSS